MKKLLLGTFNPGKIREYKFLLKGLPLQILTLKQLGIKKEFEERGKTFKENAIEKAKFYCRLSALPTLAEDSGLEIDILKGKPGVKSKKWPGDKTREKELINFTFKKLKGIPWQKRRAQLKAVLALGIPYKKKVAVFLSEGILRGFITEKPKGKLIRGYPFRSIFYLPQFKKTFAQLSFKKEVEIGHRKKALKKLIPLLKLLSKINFPLSFSLTLFEKKVLKEVEKIPYGERRTYSEIAKIISKPKGVRLVAKAISKNPLPLIIPCHRVIGKNNLGGYIFGKKIKKYLLELEKGN